MSARATFSAAFLIVISALATCAFAQASDGYVGVVTKSETRERGQQFMFSKLRRKRPFVTFPGGNGEETTKAFESDELVVLIFVAQFTGSTETFYLNKATRRFTLIEVGALEALATDAEIRPMVTHGILR